MARLDQLKGLIAHSHPDCGVAELLDHICDIAVEQLSPAEKTLRAKKASPATQRPMGAPGPLRQPILASVRCEIWRRAGGKCLTARSADRALCASGARRGVDLGQSQTLLSQLQSARSD